MNRQIPRHNAIGKKIRDARKIRGMTLEELANGICSLGKMSQIENGHRPITNEELTKLSEKLELPITHFSDPDINEKIKELDYMKQKIGDFIGLQHWSAVKNDLNRFKNKIEEYDVPTRMIDYYYLSGIFSLNSSQYEEANTCFNHVLQEQENKYNSKLKMKSYNALASMFFSQKKVSRSIELLNKALDISKENPTILKEEKDNIHFNLSILYLYIGLFNKSLFCINQVHHHIINTLDTDYMKLLIQFSDGDIADNIRMELLSLREKYHQTNDQEGILRGWALTTYALITSQADKEYFNKMKDIFLVDMCTITEIPPFQEQALGIYQLAIQGCMNFKVETSYIEKLLDVTKAIIPKVKSNLLKARNLYLEGKLQAHFSKNSLSSNSLFEQALSLLDEDYDGLLKADILYEMSQLTETKSMNVTKQALELYHQHQKGNFLFTHFHELILPSFKI